MRTCTELQFAGGKGEAAAEAAAQRTRVVNVVNGGTEKSCERAERVEST
jgi:hypothetical protein